MAIYRMHGLGRIAIGKWPLAIKCMTQYASRELDKVIVRLPDGMRDKLKEAAAKAGRTMNAEIVQRLQFTFDADVVAHDLGYDVGVSIGTPEWSAAIAKRDAPASNARMMSDADLDYLAGRLAARFELIREK